MQPMCPCHGPWSFPFDSPLLEYVRASIYIYICVYSVFSYICIRFKRRRSSPGARHMTATGCRDYLLRETRPRLPEGDGVEAQNEL